MMAVTEMQLIRKVRSPHNKVVLQAVEELRARGWLSGGTLQGMGLRCANLQGADLYKANLQGTDLRMANLGRADLSAANLQGVRLNRATLHGADLSMASLQGADLFNTDLVGVRNLSDEQLAQASRLRSARMLDGSRYDGCFNLAGDIRDAHLLNVDTDDPMAMANFYGVSLESYRRGQEWAREHLSRVRGEAEEEAPEVADAEAQFVRKLRSPHNRVVVRAIEELRARELLSSGTLKGAGLRHANLQGANLSLANLEGADLSMANLEGTDLSLANLQGANLSEANLQRANLLWAGLQGANLSEADMRGVNLSGAVLREAQLSHANLQGANLSVTNLRGADLSKVNLEGARNVNEEELAKAHRLRGAMLPDGSLYDGCFDLPGDAELKSTENPEGIALQQ